MTVLAPRPSCPGCGKPLSGDLDGLCGACLMRGALSEPPVEDDPRLAEWRNINAMRIGNFQLLDEIARGGMGIVYRARQLQPQRVVALKMMLPWLTHSPAMVERFRAEANAAAQLDHPGILQIFEVGEHESVPFFAMRFAEGGSLQQRMGRYRGDWRAIAALIAALARAIHHAHVRGILHRDLKPGNILFSQDDTALIGDFGLAKWRAVERNLTLPTAVLGSPYYMAPEQISGQFGGIGPAADIYSLGAILYELLTERTPVEADDAVSAMRLATTAVPPAPRSLNSGVPQTLESIALKCLSKSPLDRYQTGLHLAEDLEKWLEDARFRVDGPVESARRVNRLALAALAVVSTLLIAVALRIARSPPGPSAVAVPPVTILSSETGAAMRSIASVAIMPFGTEERDAANRYLSGAMRDAVVKAMGGVHGLQVTAADFSGVASKPSSSRDAAAQLGADAYLEGHVARSTANWVVEARLIRTRDGTVLWMGRFVEERGGLSDAADLLSSQLTGALGRRAGSQGRGSEARLLMGGYS